jgi:Zn-dependent metalloprotease
MSYPLVCHCGPRQHNPLHCVIPPYMVQRLAESKNPKVRRAAMANLVESAQFRTQRTLSSMAPGLTALGASNHKKNRLVYSARGARDLPGKLVRAEGQGRSSDVAVNEAYDFSGYTYDFFFSQFERQSLDNNNMSLVSTVHATEAGGGPLNNAFWNGSQMAYGDGDEVIFTRFTKAVDVVAHELTHGLQAYASNLKYQDESGALNEHFADVFGILVKQWRKKQLAKGADWLIGQDILLPAKTGVRRALRDMLNPGSAYQDDPDLGNDPQPSTYAQRYTGRLDNGGVHLNSGIANRAFASSAIALGGYAWDITGRIWYDTLLQLSPDSGFADCARICRQVAAAHGAVAKKAIDAGWKRVGL